MGDDTVLFLGGKVGVARGESGAKMIFECADRTLGGVAAVGVRGDNPEINVVLAESFLHGVGSLVVEDVESGCCTVLFEVFMEIHPGCSDLQGLLVLLKLGMDGVGVVVVDNEDVLVTT